MYLLCETKISCRYCKREINLSYSALQRLTDETLHGILFGADGGSHSWDLWSVRRQNFRSAFCSTRGELLDHRNNRHISHLLSKLAALLVYVGVDRLKLRRTNVSPRMYVETFTLEWRKKNDSVRPGLLLIASKLAHQLAGKPIEFLVEELREKKGGARDTDTDTNQAKTFPSLCTQHPKVNKIAYLSLRF